MRDSQTPFPIDVRTGWVDHSPALLDHTSQRVRSRLSRFASCIRSVTVQIADAEPHNSNHRRCHLEVITTDAGPISASTIGVDLFTIVDRTVDTVAEMVRERLNGVPDSARHRRIA
jgi:hypothetical protein